MATREELGNVLHPGETLDVLPPGESIDAHPWPRDECPICQGWD